jgi:AcrR family transcriptional regulator
VSRPREFSPEAVIAISRSAFAANGYFGTSIDDLVKATNLHRGSLYKAFGSKRNLFEAALLEVALDFSPTAENLNLLTVALKELAQSDTGIKTHCESIVEGNKKKFSLLLGNNLLSKLEDE